MCKKKKNLIFYLLWNVIWIFRFTFMLSSSCIRVSSVLFCSFFYFFYQSFKKMNTVLCRSEHLAQPSLSSPSTKLTLTNSLIRSGFVSTQMHRRQCGRTPYYQQQSAPISPSAQINGSLTSPCHAAQHNCQHLLTPFWQGPHLRILDLLFPFFPPFTSSCNSSPPFPSEEMCYECVSCNQFITFGD